MLRYLKISNLAIIDELEVDFADGFNVLTGETGAGKSILIGALNLLLGAKASPDLVRTDAEEAYVEGLFEIDDGALLPRGLDQIDCAAGELIVSRRIFRTGRSRSYINGCLATQAQLRSAGNSLVSIFGQHEHQVLMDREVHTGILDTVGGLQELCGRTRATHEAWTASERSLEAARRRLRELELVAEENAKTAEELAEASLVSGEEEELRSERETLRHAVQIREKAFEAYETLYSRSGSLLESLADVKKSTDFLASANPRLTGLRENLDDAIYRLEDVAMELRETAQSARSDPARLEAIEERLALIRRLKRKHSTDLDGLLELQEALSQEAGETLDVRAQVRKWEKDAAARRDDYRTAAQALTEARQTAAANLEDAMKNELKELAMPGAVFSVMLQSLGKDQGSPAGMEKAEFLLTANPGEAPRPLARIASGGELSRIMLALKTLQVDTLGAPTVIFDEVDAGIGGHTATAVAKRLERVARHQQVLCVTHLHQIAALARHHLSVRKHVKKGRTRTEVKPLTREERVEELARMLGASKGAEAAREHVKRLMEMPAAEVSQ